MATNGDTDNDNSKAKPIYLNWRFYCALVASLFLIFDLSCLIYGREVTYLLVQNPATYVAAVGAATTLGGAGAGIIRGLIKPIWEEIKQLRGENERVKGEVVEVKREAVTAKSTAIEVAQSTDERASLLETSNEALSKQITQVNASYAHISQMAETLTNNLQEERAWFAGELAALKADHRREIQELKDQHRREMDELRDRVNRESSADKEKINALQKRVSDLENEVAILKAEKTNLLNVNNSLVLENQQLKRGRRNTDKLMLPGPDTGEGLEGLDE